MKLIRIIALLIVGTLASHAQVDSVYYGTKHPAQERPKEPKDNAWKEKITWGGNVQAWIGNPTFILVSPTIGYIPFKNFNFGVGGIYNYINYNTSFGSYSQSIYGAHSYARYIIGDSYFVQIQYDKLLQPDLFSPDPKSKIWVNYILVGGGFRQSISDKMALSTSIMYNLSQNLLSIYPSRIIIQFGIVGTF